MVSPKIYIISVKKKGNEYFSAQDYKSAVEIYSQAITISKTDHLLLSNRSHCYVLMDQFDEALVDAEQVLLLDPNWPKGYFRKGCALYGLGRYEDAVVTFLQCLSLDPKVSSAKEYLSKTLDKILSAPPSDDAKTPVLQHRSSLTLFQQLVENNINQITLLPTITNTLSDLACNVKNTGNIARDCYVETTPEMNVTTLNESSGTALFRQQEQQNEIEGDLREESVEEDGTQKLICNLLSEGDIGNNSESKTMTPESYPQSPNSRKRLRNPSVTQCQASPTHSSPQKVLKATCVDTRLTTTSPTDTVVITASPSHTLLAKTSLADTVVITTSPSHTAVTKTSPADTAMTTVGLSHTLLAKISPADTAGITVSHSHTAVTTTSLTDTAMTTTGLSHSAVTTTSLATIAITTTSLTDAAIITASLSHTSVTTTSPTNDTALIATSPAAVTTKTQSSMDVVLKSSVEKNEMTPEQPNIDDLECGLCYRLFFEPVTTPCGHTFCRKCLDRCLDHTITCPMCKGNLSEYLADRRQTVTDAIQCIIETFFMEAYTERCQINQEEITELLRMGSDQQSDIPVFVCILAFPNIPCPLHVFEPRYRLMVRQCMESGTRQFGMCVNFGDNDDDFSDYGCMLEIRDVQYFPDGRSVVDAIGGRRFKVLNRGKRDGYNTAKVEFISDKPVDEDELQVVHSLQVELHTMVKDWLRRLPTVHRTRITQHFGEIPDLDSDPFPSPNGPKWAWWAVAVLPMDPRVQMALLAMSSLHERLISLKKVLVYMNRRGTR